MATVKELIEQYEAGAIAFPQLVTALASHEFTPKPETADWGEVYARAEEMSGKNTAYPVGSRSISAK